MELGDTSTVTCALYNLTENKVYFKKQIPINQKFELIFKLSDYIHDLKGDGLKLICYSGNPGFTAGNIVKYENLSIGIEK